MQIPRFLLLTVLLLFISFFGACSRSPDELPVIPPATHPLAREYIGYGVVNVSFAHLLSEPSSSGISRDYLRRGTVVRILERRPVTDRGTAVSWVLVEGNYQGSAAPSNGWLQETTVEIYDNEPRAKTASKIMEQ